MGEVPLGVEIWNGVHIYVRRVKTRRLQLSVKQSGTAGERLCVDSFFIC